MRVLDGLVPEKVFYYFEEICRIPHGSGNVQKISDYLVDFASERNLEYYQDRLGNVIIIKEASKGYEDSAPVMLQGHMDMVAVKKPDVAIDMTKEGLRLQIDGDRIYAKDTSLGGDDGIAIAYGLALLDDETCKHPRLELVITVDEETGMEGARGIDLSPCRATTLINLDSEEEGIFLTGCAGGARVNYGLSYTEEKAEGLFGSIKVSGLLGGHSGAEIHKERGNANCILARVLRELSDQVTLQLVSLKGGLADNAIPREAIAEVVITGDKDGSLFREETQTEGALEKLKALVGNCLIAVNGELKAELLEKDPEVTAEAVFEGRKEKAAMSAEQSQKIIAFLNAIPNGVEAMSGAMEGLVETSLNQGILTCEKGVFHVGISVRSSHESAKKALIGRLRSLAYLAGITAEVTGDYPGWAYRKDSPLREKMVVIYENMYGKKPEIQAIHAGLECGLFAHKIPELDCVSIGPDMKNIHTTEEELSISSTGRVYDFLRKLLEDMR